ncbi:DUF2303 family protein [Noviherbaspirillum sp. Root189]|uniref:DUF2303 family protein n=1 Tax=Noviherbaspirillum sp. Root189 TaxID=1736487 RepID=UPI00070C0C72|nr:DUF2303 family protein [Noviherbaspirillum sp. Root189]KRB73465.1 hypothetical protein ASE07_06325 [Noviherbaspirillum sp. Root189]
MNQHTHLDETALGKAGALMVAATAIQEAGDASFILVPQGFTHVEITSAIEKAHPAPYRKRGTVALSSIESFNEFVKDQRRTEGSYIYADPEARTLTAVFNDHEYGDRSTDAGWRDFRAVYTAELSREFNTWLKNNKQPKEQEEFAVFLEDNIADVVEPSGESLLAIALTLQAKTEVNFNTSRRLDNGQVQITYTENIDARAGAGSIEIPREFAIGCRLFKNGDGYKIRARLKYRLGGGKVKFWYELDRPENVIEDAFTAYVEKAKETGVKVLIGKP